MPRIAPLAPVLTLAVALLAVPTAAQPPTAPAPRRVYTPEQRAKLRERDVWEKAARDFEAEGKPAEAVGAAEKMLALEREVHGDVHREVALSWKRLGELHTKRDDWPAAGTAYRNLTDVLAGLYGADNWRVTEARWLVTDVGQFSRFRPADLTVVRAADGLAHQGEAFLNGGRLADAQRCYREVHQVRSRVLGTEHPLTLQALASLGEAARRAGDYREAAAHLREAVEGHRRAYGPISPGYARTLQTLSVLYKDLGEYARAEPLLREVLEVYRRTLPAGDPFVVMALNNLGMVVWDMGDVRRAEVLLTEAAGTAPAAADRLQVWGQTLNNLGLLYQQTGRPAAAEPLLREAADLTRKEHGETNPFYLVVLNNLALTYAALGRVAAAEEVYREVLALKEKTLGRGHPSYATSLGNLGRMYYNAGRFEEAEPLVRQALAVARESLGTDHPQYARALAGLASFDLAAGRPAEVEALTREAVSVSLGVLDRTADAQSELGQVRAAAQVRGRLAFYLQATTGSGTPADAYALALRWKGQAFVRVRRQRELAATLAAADPAASKLAADLLATTRRLAAASGQTPRPDQAAAWRKTVAELTTRRDELEGDLARASAAFRRQKERETLTPAGLRAALPAGTALVDFFVYSHATPDRAAAGGWTREDRLAAFVVRPDRGVARVELGPAKPVADAVAAWREQTHEAAGPAGAVLRRAVWEPVAKHLDGTATVLVSPDRDLAGFPFAALPGAKPGSYLIEDLAVAVLPVPQLLPDLAPAAAAAGPPTLLVLGGVDYDAGPGRPGDIRAARTAPGTTGAARPQWSRLPGTVGEGDAVRDLFRTRYPDGTVNPLRGADGSEEAFRRLAPAARYLHLATHGFFAPPEVASATRPGGADHDAGGSGTGGFHPGLLSGLVLAGANRPPDPLADADDGVLTALEVSTLDLRGVELAVLSACETGLGTAAGGEGVLGLQRAFQVAGVRSVVASLWAVPDDPTRVLMERFYRNLWGGNTTRAAALREAQLWMLREGRGDAGVGRGIRRLGAPPPAADGRLPPYYWAAFTLSGDWR